MKLDPILTKAVSLARNKDYDNAIKLLESESSRYYGKFIYYYILGLSYLYSKIYGIALRYFNMAIEQKLRDPNTLLALAALYLNHGDTDKAVDLYLEVQSIDVSNRLARRALKIIRKNPGPEKISAWVDSGRLHKVFPPFPWTGITRRMIVTISLSIVFFIMATLGVGLATGRLSLPEGNVRPLPEGISLELSSEERNSPVQSGSAYRYILTSDQVIDEYNTARRLFTDYRDEAARVRLNLILESNASEPVKNRARVLMSYLQEPGFDTLRERDRFTYNDVMESPFLYRDVHIIWRGMAGNLIVGNDFTSFDFLVGYDTRTIVEGIVQVNYEFAIPINVERPIEILGRIIPVSNDRIIIQGIALNQAGLLERMP